MAYQASSDAVPHGMAGLANQSHKDNVDEIGRGPYTDLVYESIQVATNVAPNSPQPTLSIGAGVSSAREDMHSDIRPNARGY